MLVLQYFQSKPISELVWIEDIWGPFSVDTWVRCVPDRIRVAGIKGLQGVVRKTVNDELQAIIWEPQHMDKLIPSMLFNMQDSDDLDRYCTDIQILT